jgi:hypothetical protein
MRTRDGETPALGGVNKSDERVSRDGFNGVDPELFKLRAKFDDAKTDVKLEA